VTVAAIEPALPDTPPPADLAPQSFAADLYDSLAPAASHDADYAWALLILCNAIGVMFQLVDDWVRDTQAGPGWSPLLDLNRCPSDALGWLGQFNGSRIPTGLTDAQQRAFIKDASAFRRGTPAAMIAAVQATLTGTQTVTLVERDGDPYYLTVQTIASETPDQAKTHAAILSQKPGGIVLGTFTPAVGVQTWATFQTKAADWSGEETKYTIWSNGLWAVPN
jgi:hypothetical protein